MGGESKLDLKTELVDTNTSSLEHQKKIPQKYPNDGKNGKLPMENMILVIFQKTKKQDELSVFLPHTFPLKIFSAKIV